MAGVKVKAKKVNDEQFDLEVTCDQCGKPITHATKYGMFCEDLCGEEEAREAGKYIDKIADMMGDMFKKSPLPPK